MIIFFSLLSYHKTKVPKEFPPALFAALTRQTKKAGETSVCPGFVVCDVVASLNLHQYPGRRLKIKTEPKVIGTSYKEAVEIHGRHLITAGKPLSS